ncbi:MAG TPA: P-loop NTPase [Candidatus Baltobacteraceae bacterium]|nr:P-loop NTPase [Candidatus Baltobacteraceae bacterium]
MAEPERMHPSFINAIRQKERVRENLSKIRHKIGVYSAKGGVGKTTTSVNIAFALMKKGFKVGLLDADIDCPNVAMFLGIEERMEAKIPLKPVEKMGVKVASTAMLVDDIKKPIIWRGPIITKMLGDFFENTDWGELDYLIVDLPPGTSDAPLTIMQLLDLDGFVIVTTPQRIAATNSIRSGLMAKRMSVSVLGVVENMSSGTISDNTKGVAEALGVEVLGVVEQNQIFNACSDAGKVPVLENQGIMEAFSAITSKITG